MFMKVVAVGDPVEVGFGIELLVGAVFVVVFVDFVGEIGE